MNNEMTNKEKEEKVLGIHDDDADAQFKAWTEEQAKETAEKLGIKLTDNHWKVIKFIRNYYADGGQAQHAREYVEALNERFADDGGSRFLYQLFPGGPVKQGCAIAGVAAPGDVSDAAFGTSM